MLKDVGCEYVIVGHSERRLLYRESDQLDGAQVRRRARQGLIPILCVGEQLAEREAGRTREVVARQLDVVLELSGAGALEQAVVAYEPVWAIGTGRTASPSRRRRCTPSSAPGSGPGMLELPAPRVFCMAAASRPAMRRSCSRCRMSTAD